jgi:oxygen-independent coproporphyrinogen-3 oxidase
VQKELDLFLKYHNPGSRYSYFPSVPHWKNQISIKEWGQHLKQSYDPKKGIDLYIHIPFCESLCTFCGCNIKITKNKKEGLPYVETLEKEWNQYKELLGVKSPKISSVYLGGGTPTFLSERALQKIFQFLFPQGPQNLLEGTIEIDPRFITLEKLKLFKAYGIKRISLGVQDFDETILSNVNRLQKKEQVEKVLELSKALDLEEISLDIIYGLPFQTPQSMNTTFDSLTKIAPEIVTFYPLALVPWQKKGQMAFGNFCTPSIEEKYKLYLTGKDALIKKGYINAGMGFFIKKKSSLGKSFGEKKLKRNLMGVFNQKSDFLLGLGVSSMSQVKNILVQNERILEKYLFEINKDQSAIWRSHKRSHQEQITQNIFEDLISDKSIYIPSDFMKRPSFLNKINCFKKDNIINEKNQHLNVTNQGKDFLKNIFQTFDFYLPPSNIGP